MKKIIFLCGVLLSAPLMSMELVKKEDADKERSLWPRHVTPLILEANFKSHKKIFVNGLACVNKELAEDVPYEEVRLRWKSWGFNYVLSCIVHHRKNLLPDTFYAGRSLKRDRYLTIAKRFLDKKCDLNSPIITMDYGKITVLQEAAYYKDKELCKLFLEHGGNPYIPTVRWEPQGPGYEWTAFDYANKPNQYGEGDKVPRGWLKELCDEVQGKRKS